MALAIASITFDVCVPVVDGNVCRVLLRLTGVANHTKPPLFKDGLGWKLAEQIVSADGGRCAGEVNQAMMELGVTYVIAAMSLQLLNDGKKTSKKRSSSCGSASSNIEIDEYWLMVKRPKGGLLAGQWEFPSRCIWSSNSGDVEKSKTKQKFKSKQTNDIQIPKITLEGRRNAIIESLQQYDFSHNSDAFTIKMMSIKKNEHYT